MRLIFATILCLATPACADLSRMSLEGPSGHCFAVVKIEHRIG